MLIIPPLAPSCCSTSDYICAADILAGRVCAPTSVFFAAAFLDVRVALCFTGLGAGLLTYVAFCRFLMFPPSFLRPFACSVAEFACLDLLCPALCWLAISLLSRCFRSSICVFSSSGWVVTFSRCWSSWGSFRLMQL